MGWAGGAVQAVPGHRTTYQVVQQGQGSELVRPGCTIKTRAVGVLQQTGKQFWSTEEPGKPSKPFEFRVGDGAVVTGWDVGVIGMRVGEKRRLVIPGNEGYGKRGYPSWGIPPDALLAFTVELLELKP
eukprot:TRINITY_DN72012_c0_g1_i1.p2 TRINITY_DN72012_c0_g1~~TRINITY_DN72012_c0_g1_i1.p2  ORF type:complete len:128 (+),score=22.48 TRINITY_DN72012_c0_g1_i1:99-482(+)